MFSATQAGFVGVGPRKEVEAVSCSGDVAERRHEGARERASCGGCFYSNLLLSPFEPSMK